MEIPKIIASSSYILDDPKYSYTLITKIFKNVK